MVQAPTRQRWRSTYRSSEQSYATIIGFALVVAIITYYYLVPAVQKLAWWYVARYESANPF